MNDYIFNCDKINDEALYQKFQSNFMSYNPAKDISNIFLGNNIYNTEAIMEEIDVVISEIQREWFFLQSIPTTNILQPDEDVLYSRNLINASFRGIKESLIMCSCPMRKVKYKKIVIDELKCIFNSIVPVKIMKEDFVIKISSMKESDAKTSVNQYFHTFLEIQYHLLFLSYICELSDFAIEEFLEKIMDNFVHLSKKNYERQTSKIFTCPCLRQFWLIMQLFTEKIKDSDMFWKIFNKKLEHEDSLFSLWLLTQISELQLINEFFQNNGNGCPRIRPNYDLLQNKLKTVLSNEDSGTLSKLFKLIIPLLTNYWLKHARVEVYQTLWDFYSKRLNISKKSYSNLSALDLDTALTNILSSPNNCTEDFEQFLAILICHLREYPNHWGKMKGRMYSQLGPHKLKELNDNGIVHVTFLFSALSYFNYEELSKKILVFFEGISQEKRNNPLIWNVYLCFVFMQVRRNTTLDKTAPIMLSWLQEASLDHTNHHLIKMFISNFEHILNFSPNMMLHQWTFINSWLIKYLSFCYHKDMKFTLEVILSVLEKVENPDSWPFWIRVFRDFVYPVIKQLSSIHNAPKTIGQIAGKLYLLIPHSSKEIFSYFTSDIIPPQITLSFLIIVLEDYPSTCILNAQQETDVIQCWIKVCLLSSEPYSALTKIVTKFDTFPMHLKSYINSSEDPLRALVEYLGSDIKTHIQSSSIQKFCEVCFGNIDKWLPQYLNHPENESIVFKLYISISFAFLHCGALLYNRNKSSSPLTRMVQCMLLSSDFLLGKPPHEFVLNSIKKTWHIFYESLVKLKSDSDMYIDRTLRDMLTKYMSHFPSNNSPVLKCIENEMTADVILEKICTSYFKHPVKESENNLLKVIKMLNDIVQSTTSVTLLRLITSKTLCGLFELVIMHSQRSVAINLIKVITQSPLYPQVRTDFASSIISTTEKHLGFNANNYFQLMYILVKFIPSDISGVLEKIGEQVTSTEKLRGVGYDYNLRSQLEKLRTSVKDVQ
ncbi:protein MMS22-like [Diabrotica undecimpunctata]|uniref:protein MMS22-like n=1 Tax=Diabrotica undecimpunctata TaxID=50387 RepID=UPI003B6383D9